jgi:hypothetical protein
MNAQPRTVLADFDIDLHALIKEARKASPDCAHAAFLAGLKNKYQRYGKAMRFSEADREPLETLAQRSRENKARRR